MNAEQEFEKWWREHKNDIAPNKSVDVARMIWKAALAIGRKQGIDYSANSLPYRAMFDEGFEQGITEGRKQATEDQGDALTIAYMQGRSDGRIEGRKAGLEEAERIGHLRWPNHYASKEQGIKEGRNSAFEEAAMVVDEKT